MSEDFSGLIPVDPESLTTEYAPLDDSIPYEVMLAKLETGKTDKNGDSFMGAQYQVVSPDEWKGRMIFDSYIPYPKMVSSDMDYAARRKAQDAGVPFARMLKCFKLKIDEGGFDPGSAIGAMGTITIKNEEYNGKLNARVKNYLF